MSNHALSSAPDSSFLQTQIAQLENERATLRAAIARESEGLAEEQNRLAAIANSIQKDMQEAAALEKQRVLKAARGKVLLPALKLAPWGGKWAWIALAVWAIVQWRWALVLAGVPYVLLVFFGIQRAAKKQAQADFAAIDGYAAFKPALASFGTEESGDPNYPYSIFYWPELDGKSLINGRVDKSFGAQFGANFLAFSRDDGFCLFSRFATSEYSVQCISWDKLKTDSPEFPLLSSLAKKQLEKSKQHVPVIAEYAKKREAILKTQRRANYLDRRIETLRNAERDWGDVALKQETLDSLLKLVDAFISNRTPTPKGMLLYGPPGTGKTLIARKLAKNAGCHFIAASVADLKGPHIGQTAPLVKKVWEQARQQAPCILFVDECESVFATRGSTSSDAFGAELVQTFLSEWDGFSQAAGKVFVIGATNRHDLIDNAILSRFTETIEIGPPDAAGRQKILASEFAKAGMTFAPDEAMTRETAGMSGRDIATLVAKIAANTVGNVISAADFLAETRKLRGKGSTSVNALTWEDVILPEATKKEFKSLGRELVHAEELRKLNVDVPRGILLYGPPGTGKTQIARVLAGESGLSFIAAASSDLKANYIGQSGGKVKQLFEKARAQAPCILFIDEIDAVAKQRGGGDSFTEEIVAQLLQELDGVATKSGQIFLLAASNHPDSIDGALLSRMERKIHIGLPDEAARAAILRLQLAGKPLAFDLEQACDELAKRTEGKSGRDLQSQVTTATRNAVQRAMANTGDPRDLKLEMADFPTNV